jgi:hypothetical protein
MRPYTVCSYLMLVIETALVFATFPVTPDSTALPRRNAKHFERN